jgi:hypothetical protein
MKLDGYNTFYVDAGNINDNKDYNINEKKQCLICLQGPEQSSNNIIIDDVKLMNDMHFLIKACKCECYSHHKCIEKWIENKSVCPICKGPISFPKSGLKEVIIQMPGEDINVERHANELLILQNTTSNNCVCFRFIFIIFCCFVFITLLNNINP